MPWREDWKAWAVPWKFVLIVAGSVLRARVVISLTASPIDTPGLRLKEMVTDGSWPEWLTDRGPMVRDQRRHGAQRDERSRGRANVQLGQVGGRKPEAGLEFHNDPYSLLGV